MKMVEKGLLREREREREGERGKGMKERERIGRRKKV